MIDLKLQYVLFIVLFLAFLAPVQAASGQVNLVVIVPSVSPSPSPSPAPSIQPTLTPTSQTTGNPATGFAIAFDAEGFFRQAGSAIQNLLSKLVFWR